MVRMPFELSKQRLQANRHLTVSLVVRNILATEVQCMITQKLYLYMCLSIIFQGPRGFFRGYFSTVARDIPFSFIQYPLWEYLKVCVRDHWPTLVSVFTLVNSIASLCTYVLATMLSSFVQQLLVCI